VRAFFFALRSLALFEFLDNDGVPGFQQTNGTNADHMVTFYDLSNPNLAWKPLVINTTKIMDTNGTLFNVSYIEAETLDEVFFVRFVVTERPIYVGSVLVTADKSKIDFGIKYYNVKHVAADWSTGPSTLNTTKIGYLAVTLSAAVFADFKNGTAVGPGESSAISFGGEGVVGSFEWDPTADVHVQGEVVKGAVYAQVTDHSTRSSADVFATFNFKFLFFSFEGHRSDLIFWDPVMGANITYNTASTSMNPMGTSMNPMGTSMNMGTHMADIAISSSLMVCYLITLLALYVVIF